MYIADCETSALRTHNDPVLGWRNLTMPYDYPQYRLQRTALQDYAPFELRRYGRHWEVRDPAGQLVCLTVYRRGAAEVIRRLKLIPEFIAIGEQR